jgi:hypothetical protein
MSQRSLRLPVVALAITLSLAAGCGGENKSEREAQSHENLKSIGLACNHYHAAFNGFPTSTHDTNGKPLLSWRVEILPYLENLDLYTQFHRDEPWDSDHNLKLIARMPDVYKAPGINLADKTVYLQPVGPDAMFPRDKSDPRQPKEVPRVKGKHEQGILGWSVSFEDIKDGAGVTVMVVEADPKRAVIWTKPDDFEFDGDKPKAGLGGVFSDSFHVEFPDGLTHFIPLTTDDNVVRDLFNPADGHNMDFDWLKSTMAPGKHPDRRKGPKNVFGR